ncbi:CheR family methyltransferase [Clostridium vincentii]|nr:protein-glutamate O-methyltransferase CheR [Clostridium vincentii]
MNTEDIEVALLLEAIYMNYGYDFRSYSRAHIKRRVKNRLVISGLKNISEIQHMILTDRTFFQLMLPDFSINVTEMFRDPSFFLSIRKEVIPVLKTYPHVKIWHAGCSTGEEVYSMAILLKEEGSYSKTQIYATDFNESVLSKGKEGIYPIDRIKEYTINYQKAGGKESFSDYYIANYDFALLDKALKERIIFAEHNLVNDNVFGEMQMIVCRNVLIYFNKELQNHVIKLFYDSLCNGGFLCLGPKESLKFTEFESYFEPIVESDRIFRKKFK